MEKHGILFTMMRLCASLLLVSSAFAQSTSCLYDGSATVVCDGVPQTAPGCTVGYADDGSSWTSCTGNNLVQTCYWVNTSSWDMAMTCVPIPPPFQATITGNTAGIPSINVVVQDVNGGWTSTWSDAYGNFSVQGDPRLSYTISAYAPAGAAFDMPVQNIALPQDPSQTAQVVFAEQQRSPTQNATTAAAAYSCGTYMLMPIDGIGYVRPCNYNVTPVLSAQFISQNVLDQQDPFTPQQGVTVTMKNTGQGWWYPGLVWLQTESTSYPEQWGIDRVDLPGAVGPGASYSFPMNIKMPQVISSLGVGFKGDFRWVWRMHSTAGGFGDFTPTVNVTLVPYPYANPTVGVSYVQSFLTIHPPSLPVVLSPPLNVIDYVNYDYNSAPY